MQHKSKTYITGLYLLTLLCSLTAYGQGQIKTTNLSLTKLPNGIKFSGKIKTAVRWTDKSGDNIVITTETGEKTNKKEEPTDDGREASLYAYHYIVGKDSTFLAWKIYDFVKDCSFDIEASFIKNSFQVTDLNNDGVAEVWIMYKIVCTSDVSPCDMKIIMYQGQQKYAMRGQNKVKVSDKEFYGGDYKFDNAFLDGPTMFRDFAKKMWNKNIMQIWGG